MLVLKGLVGLHRTIQLQLLQCYWLGHRLRLLWYWMVCFGNRDHSVVFEIASKYWILDSFVDHDGYCISFKGFLPTVVDIMVHFSSLIPRMSTFVSCFTTSNLPWFIQGMASHFSILALRTPWTVWKGKMIGCWKRNSPGQYMPNMLQEISG